MQWLKKFGYAVVVLFAVIGAGFTAVFIAMQFGLLNVRGSIDTRNQFFLGTSTPEQVASEPCDDTAQTVCNWNQTPEWAVVAGGLEKDARIIVQVARETDVPPRLIAATVIPEQIRFFTSEREVFKRYFEPLKILGSLSQFSLGVSGIKQETAVAIEQFIYDPSSQFYPGRDMSGLIAYDTATTAPHDTQLFNRLTDEHNHYYSYLYTALYIKEIEAQWAAQGFPIDDKPAIVITLFNLGFQASHPNANPVAAGAGITVGGRTYPFGVLGGAFYDSNELIATFPK